MGPDDTVIGGQGCGGFDGRDTLGDDSATAHVLRTDEGCEGGTARALRRHEERPATQEVAAERGVFFLKPMAHVWKRGREGTGQAVGEPPCVTDHTAPVLNELDEGAPGGLCGQRGCSWSRWGSSSASWRAASVGSSWAWLGVQASRDRASLRGLRGKRPRKSYWRTAETRGPWLRARHMATGRGHGDLLGHGCLWPSLAALIGSRSGLPAGQRVGRREKGLYFS